MELWDIYDENRNLTGRTMTRDDWHMAPGDYHVSVTGAVVTPEGLYLITQRREDKPWGAGWWEFPGGAVLAGETPMQAVMREVQEETGIDVSGCEPELACSYVRVNPDEQNNYFMDVYRFRLDVDIEDVHVQESEVAAYKLASLDEIIALGEQGVFMHYDSIKEMFD